MIGTSLVNLRKISNPKRRLRYALPPHSKNSL